MARSDRLIRFFRIDFRLDEYGETMGAWFAVAEYLYSRGAKIPTAWNFRPSPNLRATRRFNASEHGLWGEVITGCSPREVRRFGDVLVRYAALLTRHGRAY